MVAGGAVGQSGTLTIPEVTHMTHAILATFTLMGAVAAPVPKHLMPKDEPY